MQQKKKEKIIGKILQLATVFSFLILFPCFYLYPSSSFSFSFSISFSFSSFLILFCFANIIFLSFLSFFFFSSFFFSESFLSSLLSPDEKQQKQQQQTKWQQLFKDEKGLQNGKNLWHVLWQMYSTPVKKQRKEMKLDYEYI